MSIFAVNEEKCKRDGICVSEYPVKIIVLKDKECGADGWVEKAEKEMAALL